MNRVVDKGNDKKFFAVFGIVFIIAVAVFIWIFISINNKFKSTSDLGLLTINTTESIVPNDSISTSFSQDKSINDISNQTLNKVINQTVSGEKTNVSAGTAASKNVINEKGVPSQKEEKVVKEEKQPEVRKELKFIAPVVGEIITDYADESLIYSKTLDEWTTHFGIDIKADKTSSVVSAEDGIVKSIKNDPRYGLSVIISHEDGYETLYANLLSADFVKEGDKVSKNQTIGTIGESASFEISEQPHLHFEILQNGENVNPTTLIK